MTDLMFSSYVCLEYTVGSYVLFYFGFQSIMQGKKTLSTANFVEFVEDFVTNFRARISHFRSLMNYLLYCTFKTERVGKMLSRRSCFSLQAAARAVSGAVSPQISCPACARACLWTWSRKCARARAFKLVSRRCSAVGRGLTFAGGSGPCDYLNVRSCDRATLC